MFGGSCVTKIFVQSVAEQKYSGKIFCKSRYELNIQGQDFVGVGIIEIFRESFCKSRYE